MRLGRLIFTILFLGSGKAAADPHVDAAVQQLVSLGVKAPTARSVVERWVERDANRDPRPLLQTIRRASENQAPVDLLLDKTAEGLAKGVSGDRLLRALDDWGKNLGQAARLARVLRSDLNSEGVSERETILRLGILQRLRKDDGWLRRLEEEAKQNEVNLHGFLQVSEAVSYLSGRLGLDEKEADDLGALWMKKRMPPNEVYRLVRALEKGRPEVSVSDAVRAVTESVLRGSPPEDALTHIEKKTRETKVEKDRKTKEKKEKEERVTRVKPDVNSPPSAAQDRKDPPENKKEKEKKDR